MKIKQLLQISSPVSDQGVQPYLPRLASTWTNGPLRELEGTLVSVDLSGFTALSERLATRGKEGAEELILLVSGCFEGLIRIAARHGGDVLKFRGDALLILFDGDRHAERACRASAQMQWFIANAAPSRSSVGPVSLTMTTGVHSGLVQVHAVGTSHTELMVTGRAATRTIALESAASSGEILVSAPTAALVDADWLGEEREDGARLLRLDPTEPGEESSRPEVVAHLHSGRFVPAPLRAALAAGVESEHRHVVAAFVKFSGSDALEPSELNVRLTHLGDVAGSACDDLGLTWLESDIDVDGGKLYLTGGAPSSTGDDEGAMLHALKRIVAADVGLELHAGVNSGIAFAGDVGAHDRRTYAVTGDTVNLAARLTARAAAGEVLATEAALDASSVRYATTSKPLLVKGKERAVTAYSVGDTVGAKEERTHELPLVGRDQEVAVLAAALDAARRRTSTLVELVGDAGIGKSRLLEELKTRALGFQQLVTSCDPYSSSTPYAALHGLLRPLVGITPETPRAEAGAQLAPWIEGVMPDLTPWLPLLAIAFDADVPPTPDVEGLDPKFVHERLHECVAQFLQRMLMMPTLIVVEDAHWLDDASAFLLRHLTRTSAPVPWLVVITRRPGGEPFASEEHGETLELRPLEGAAAESLALAAAGDVALTERQLEAVRARAAGNPLFVRELVRATQSEDAEALPQTVEALLTARIDRLAPADRQLLRYASVLGASFELDLAAEVLTGEIDDAGALERWEPLRDLVALHDGRASFVHDLFRTSAYEGLSLRRRRELHARVAAALERHGEAPALLSLHFFEAGDFGRAWEQAVAAGERAKETLANVVAAELFERALAAAAHVPDLPDAEVARVCEALGDVCTVFAAFDRATEAYELALSRAGEETKPRLLWRTGIVEERTGRYEEALARYESAVSSGAEGVVRIEVELAIAGVRHRQGSQQEAREWAERAARDAEAAGARKSLAHAYYLLDAICTKLGRPSASYGERALPIYRETGDLLGQASVLNNLGMGAYFEGRWTEALELYRESGEVSRRAGDVISGARAHNNVAEILADQGRLADAVELLAEARRVWRAGRYPIGVQVATSNLGRAEARAGRFDRALELLEDARRGFADIGATDFELDAQAREVECLVLAGRHQEAIAIATEALGRAEQAEGTDVVRVSLARSLGYAHAQARRTDDARTHLEQSATLARRLNLEYELALTLKALADTGVDAAVGQQAEAILERLGVVQVAEPPLP
jgi:class 3 adenylate cyclase/tetratricopeptide (TPR) repeat protein